MPRAHSKTGTAAAERKGSIVTGSGADLEWETSRSELVKRSIFELNKLDALARDMERKWGVGRLPLLVPDELSDRFFSQHRKTGQALRSGDP